MPHGFFTIEQWKAAKDGRQGKWVAVAHLDACHTLSDAIQGIEKGDRPGFYRVV